MFGIFTREIVLVTLFLFDCLPVGITDPEIILDKGDQKLFAKNEL